MAKDSQYFFDRCVELASNCEFQERPTEADWKHLEREIARQVPNNHKQFVSHFGSGTFGEDLYLLNPRAAGRCRFDARRLLENREEKHLLLEDAGCKIFPEKNLVLIAFTTSRMDLLLDVQDQSGTKLLFLDLGQLSQFPQKMSFAEFVCRLYLGDLDQEWAESVRRSIWIERETPFFRPFTTA